MADFLLQIVQSVVLSRYFTAAGLVVVLYDALITIEDEVSRFSIQPFMLHSLSGGSSGLARAFCSSEATLLHQPVLDDCFIDGCQLLWVLRTPYTSFRH